MHHQCSWSAHRRIDQCFHRRSKNWCCRRPTVAATLDPIETVCGVSLHMNASGLASPHHLEADSRTWQINESVVPIAAKVQYQDTRSSQGEGQPTAREGRAPFFPSGVMDVVFCVALLGECVIRNMTGTQRNRHRRGNPSSDTRNRSGRAPPSAYAPRACVAFRVATSSRTRLRISAAAARCAVALRT